ncbi:MAG: 7-cyano-7-deazaguanine synthase QueC [Thermoguttaceae bacterium]|nr:7-cyano-7-deazaguanine synthase QueC [Thermoguttaceae bacterium]
MKAVVLLSGGLDSTTICSLAAAEGREIYALTLAYHQRHEREIEFAKQTAKAFGAKEHIVFPVALDLFGGSTLTDLSRPVSRDVPLSEIGQAIPDSYVPARNTVFLSLALACAETRGAQEIWLGVNSVDYSGYPDCRPEFLDAFEHLAHLATKAGVEKTASFRIRAPLLHLTKGEIIRLGMKHGVDYSKTLTCYTPDEQGRACGHCESCLLRLDGFRQAGLTDPAAYV